MPSRSNCLTLICRSLRRPIGCLASFMVIGTPCFLNTSTKTTAGARTYLSTVVPLQSRMQAFTGPTYERANRKAALIIMVFSALIFPKRVNKQNQVSRNNETPVTVFFLCIYSLHLQICLQDKSRRRHRSTPSTDVYKTVLVYRKKTELPHCIISLSQCCMAGCSFGICLC